MNTADRQRAARALSAGLALLLEHAHAAGMPEELVAPLVNVRESIEQALPPWKPEPTPGTPLPWSQVVPGDSVLAPNGTWYRVDSVARIGEQVRALLILHEDAVGKRTVPTERSAGETVQVRRGDTGRAVDIFRAGGLDVETIGSEG